MDTQVIQTTVGEVTEALAKHGVASDRLLTVTVEPNDWISRGRRVARPLVEADGLTDDDIDVLIDEARRDANREMRQASANG